MEYRLGLLRRYVSSAFSFALLARSTVDDEDTNDYQASSMVKSDEHERFKKDKEDFKRKYQEQINQVMELSHTHDGCCHVRRDHRSS